MSTIIIKSLNQPSIYVREYKNDLPQPSSTSHIVIKQSLRVAQVALPFISLYKPIGRPLSIVLGGVRVVTSLAQLANAVQEGTSKDIGRSALEVAVATTAVACSILAHPLGMLVTTTHDMIKNLSDLIQAFQKGDYHKMTEISLHLVSNALYLSCFAVGSIQLSIASIGMQIVLGLYHSRAEYKKGNYLEALGHAAMAGIRGKQAYDQVQTLLRMQELQKLFAQAAHAAREPVVARREAAPPLVVHSQNSKTAGMVSCGMVLLAVPTAVAAVSTQQPQISHPLKTSNTQESSNDLVNVLIKYGNHQYHTPLMEAVDACDIASVTTLLKNGFDPNELSNNDHVLRIAIRRQNMPIFKLLLDFEADPNKMYKSYDAKISVMSNVITGYCLNSGDSFYKQFIDEMMHRKIKLDQTILEYKDKKYTAIQAALSLKVLRELSGMWIGDATEDQKNRGAELATLFVQNK